MNHLFCNANFFQNWNWKGTEFSLRSLALEVVDGLGIPEFNPIALVLKRFCIVLKSFMLICCVFALFDEFERPNAVKGSEISYWLGVDVIGGCEKFIVLNMLAIVLKSIGFGSAIELIGLGFEGLVKVCCVIVKRLSGELVVGAWLSILTLFVANIICMVLKSAMLNDGVIWAVSVWGVEHNSSNNNEAFGACSYFFGSEGIVCGVPKFMVLNIHCIVLKSWIFMLISTGSVDWDYSLDGVVPHWDWKSICIVLKSWAFISFGKVSHWDKEPVDFWGMFIICIGTWVLNICCMVENCSGVISITCVLSSIRFIVYSGFGISGWVGFFFIDTLL